MAHGRSRGKAAWRKWIAISGRDGKEDGAQRPIFVAEGPPARRLRRATFSCRPEIDIHPRRRANGRAGPGHCRASILEEAPEIPNEESEDQKLQDTAAPDHGFSAGRDPGVNEHDERHERK